METESPPKRKWKYKVALRITLIHLFRFYLKMPKILTAPEVYKFTVIQNLLWRRLTIQTTLKLNWHSSTHLYVCNVNYLCSYWIFIPLSEQDYPFCDFRINQTILESIRWNFKKHVSSATSTPADTQVRVYNFFLDYRVQLNSADY